MKVIAHIEKKNLNAVIGANIILIHGFQPTNIIMWMRHQMNIDLPRHNPGRGIIHHVLRLHA